MPKSTYKISFATKIIPQHNWDDDVLSIDKKEQIRKICDYAKRRPEIFETGNPPKNIHGASLNVWFSGPSKEDKKTAVEIIASELKLDLFRIDLSIVVSKYIGETEKNLNTIFKDAENRDAILFFDEADALFGKRDRIKDSHTRYANVEINYFLQKVEEHSGIVIIASNLSWAIDEAFQKRMNFIEDFKSQK